MLILISKCIIAQSKREEVDKKIEILLCTFDP